MGVDILGMIYTWFDYSSKFVYHRFVFSNFIY